jgi:hypothetical protein
MHSLVTIAELVEQAQRQGRPVTESYLRRLCRDRRIPGAFKVGATWALPSSYAERWLDQWLAKPTPTGSAISEPEP